MEKSPLGLPLLSTGLNLGELDLHGGEGFWDEVRRAAARSTLGAHLDGAIAGRAAPRVWVVLGGEAAVAGLIVADRLAERGQTVVLLDADEANPCLTRWIGRHEQEGWIDIVRYGASLHVASDVLPSPTRRGSVVGVGSFTPTGVTEAEIGELVGRLRRQCDDLIIVAPAGAPALPWCRLADVKLLTWDRLERSAEAVAAVVADLGGEDGVTLDGLVGFGVEEYAAVQRLTPPLEPEPEPEPVPAPAAEDEFVFAAEPKRRGWLIPAGIVAVLAIVFYVSLELRGRNATTTLPPADKPPVAAQPQPDSAAILTQAAPVETTAAAPVVQPLADQPPPSNFDPAVYQQPVGEAGWALWVYSLHTEAAAQKEIDELAALGIKAAARAVELKDKGRWHRIYVGSFPSRQAADAAAPALLARLHHNWSQAARF